VTGKGNQGHRDVENTGGEDLSIPPTYNLQD